jgi:hypothetical protein
VRFRRFWVSCEDVFTTETQRGTAATKTRIISRKDAKAAKGYTGKFEARNPKHETISNDKKTNVPNKFDSDLSFGF